MQSKIEIPAELHTFTKILGLFMVGGGGGGTESATFTWSVLGF